MLEQLSRALGYVHQRGYLHNDLKENNVVLHITKEHWTPVIIDFGKSRKITASEPRSKQKEAQHYHWIAPEVLDGTSAQTIRSDVFSLGRILRFVIKSVFNRDELRYSKAKEIYLACVNINVQLRPKSAQAVAAKLHTLL